MEFSFDEWRGVLAVAVALALGGIVKGATGAGAPVVAVPVIAAFFDIRAAVVIMLVPNLVTNLWQAWSFRAATLPERFGLRLAGFGACGAIVGSIMLAHFSAAVLTIGMAVIILLYVGLRLLRPAARLSFAKACRWVGLAGVVAGTMQGAAGISAPVSVTFLNAMRLERPAFIVTISVFFAAMSAVQMPTLWAYDLISPVLLAGSVAALIPLFLFMRVGSWLARHLSAQAFDRLTLVLLTLLAVRLVSSQL